MLAVAVYCLYCRLLDTDSYLYRDPYKYLKVPPLSNVTFMSMADNGNIINGGEQLRGRRRPATIGASSALPPLALHAASPCLGMCCSGQSSTRTAPSCPLPWPVGGTSYIQNAAPGGPAAWTIAHMCERMIRVNEQWEWFSRASNISDLNHLGHAMMDQARIERGWCAHAWHPLPHEAGRPCSKAAAPHATLVLPGGAYGLAGAGSLTGP